MQRKAPQHEASYARASQLAGRWLLIFDAWCGWCHGFWPTVAALRAEEPERPWLVLPGGLHVGDRRGKSLPADIQARANARVRAETGVLFGQGYLDALASGRLKHDSESAARAFEALRHVAPELVLTWAQAQSDAVWQAGQDPADPMVLRAMAEAHGVDAEAVLAHHASPACAEEVARRFAQVQSYGVEAFPTLMWAQGSKGLQVASGAASADKVRQRLAAHGKLLSPV